MDPRGTPDEDAECPTTVRRCCNKIIGTTHLLSTISSLLSDRFMDLAIPIEFSPLSSHVVHQRHIATSLQLDIGYLGLKESKK